jgi:hypothetical protein
MLIIPFSGLGLELRCQRTARYRCPAINEPVSSDCASLSHHAHPAFDPFHKYAAKWELNL